MSRVNGGSPRPEFRAGQSRLDVFAASCPVVVVVFAVFFCTRMTAEEAELFGTRLLLLRAIGCLFDADGPSLGYSLVAFASLSNAFLGVLLSFCALAGFVAAREDIETICGQAIASIIAFQVFSKSGLTFLNSRRLHRLIRDLNVVLYGSFVRTDRDRNVVRRCRSYDFKLSAFFCVFSTFVTVANVLKPLVVTLSRDYDGAGVRLGEFPSEYPFRLEADSFWYSFWFCQQVLVVLPGGVASWVSDSLFCGCLYYICGHFDILMNRIREGGVEADAAAIARHHRRLIRFSRETIKVFGPIMVIQLLLAAITICCLLFQFFSVTGELVQYSRPITYLTLKLIQIYIMCWHGQLLLDKSTQLSEVLYFTPWYGTSRIDRRHLRIMMMRAQVPVRVIYGGIFHLSAGTFAQILNAAYGYFAMMSKMKRP